MQLEMALLESNAVVAWFDRDRQVSTNEMAAFLADRLGALQPDVVVVLHHPEKYLVRFIHKHHAELAASCRVLPFGDTKLQLRAWRLEAHAEHVDLGQHVRLCLEGLPLYAWDDLAVANAVGSGCSLDYIEPASKLKTDTQVLSLWAWTPCLSKVPRVSWVILPARNGGAPIYGRKGLEHRVLMHLDTHEDPSSGRLVSKPFTWRYNIVDGEAKARDRRERVSRPVRQDRRDRDEDGDHGRGRDGRDASRGGQDSGACAHRSLSRAPRDDQRHGQDRGSRDDHRGNRDGRRRAASPPPPPAAAPVLLGSGAAPVLFGSGADCDPEACALEMGRAPPATALAAPVEARGRSPSRHARPGSARRDSRDARTPPASPPLSPKSVLRSPPPSKRDEARVATEAIQERSPALIELCSPVSMLSPLLHVSPVRPPGFEASPTPPLLSSGPLQRTPTSPRARKRADDDVLPAGLAELLVPSLGVALPEPLFCARQPALLMSAPDLPPSPASTPPRKPAARRKTLTGVKISKVGGLSLQRIRRPAVLAATTPAAQAAEQFIGRSLGIIKNGQDVTTATLDAFAVKFKEQLPPDVIVAMREFFELDNGAVTAVEDALIEHGGAGVLDAVGADVAAGSLDVNA
uniref:DUF4283 domain-containing protein n=1 Tax=Aegilops tauschii subsp. strangulata TaxID=200361 RepID=A0A452ZBH3_AEGTS